MMRSGFFTAIVSLCLISCSRTVYVVRHAEKITSDSMGKMSATDPALSEAGKVRAIVLKEELGGKHIKHIYSTNTIRTRSTAEPLGQATKVNVELYSNIDSLIANIRSEKGNALVIGHSNTVDDIVNKLCGRVEIPSDLKDGQYDDLFIVKIKGKKVVFSRRKYGYPSNP